MESTGTRGVRCGERGRLACSETPPTVTAPGREAYLRLADEIEAALRKDVLEAWFPRAIDEKNGGFRADFARDWSPAPSRGKSSVFQGRMTWVAAQVAMRRSDLVRGICPTSLTASPTWTT